MLAETAAVIITSCGKRKSLEPSAGLRAAALRPGEAASVARQWAHQIAREAVRLPARSLYQGRGFREAENAAAPLSAKIYVLSAGMGLIPVDLEIPSYALTVADGTDSILSKLRPSAEASPGAWWRELSKVTDSLSFDALIGGSKGPVLLAAGSAYLAMIGHELEALDRAKLSRVRLFTAANCKVISLSLQPLVMPYDRRLEALPGRSGTMSDFAQRALRHFAETVLRDQPLEAAETHAAAVRLALATAKAPVRQRGASMSDDEIVRLICDNWNAVGGKSAAMLRLLRDSFRVACEQKRFKKLFAVARLELNS